MKDSEFYTVSEEWPQPQDASCTLHDEQDSPRAKPKKKAGGRLRKRMSESLAGVTAAVVAVAMLAASLPSLKDVFDDIPIVDEIIPQLTTPAATVPVISGGQCPMCEKGNCPYFSAGPMLRVSFPGKAEALSYDLDQMNGFTQRDYDGGASFHAVLTQTGQRLVMEMDVSLHELGGMCSWSRVSDNPLHLDEQRPAASGVFWGRSDPYEPENNARLYLYLAYSPDGDYTGVQIGNALEGLQFYAYPVDGIANAQVHAYSDLADYEINDVQSYYHVEVIDQLSNQYPLGDTMHFQENENVYRSFLDDYNAGQYFFRETENEPERSWTFYMQFPIKQYGTNHGQITFAATSWTDIFQEMAALNEQAPQYGHKVCFPILYLGETAVNSITYRCYAIYMDDNSQEKTVTYAFVPVQEPEILITFSADRSEEEMTALLSGAIDADSLAQQCEILRQVTLR